MTPEEQLRSFLTPFLPEVAARTRALRSKLRKRLPGAVEMVYDNYNALVIGFGPTERASEAILSIAATARGVNLCFLQSAARLPDPGKLLLGGGKVSRHIVIDDPAMLDRPLVRSLITEAVVRAKLPLDPKTSGRLIIKSVSPNRRPRRPGGTAVTAPGTEHTVAEHFRNRAPAVGAVYRKILRATRKFGPVHEEAKKTSIHLVRTTAFAGVATRKDSLILTLKSAADIVSPRIRKRERTSANRWHVEVRLGAENEVDAELTNWLRRSYDLS